MEFKKLVPLAAATAVLLLAARPWVLQTLESPVQLAALSPHATPSAASTMAALVLLGLWTFGLQTGSKGANSTHKLAFVLAVCAGLVIPASAANGPTPSPFEPRSPKMTNGGSGSLGVRLAKISRTTPRLTLRGGADTNTHMHKFDLRKGVAFKSEVWKKDGGLEARFSVTGDIEGLTLHWGVAMKADDEWTTPKKAGVESIIPQDSMPYKDRAIRSPLKRQGKCLEVKMWIPDEIKPQVPLGIRFVLFEPSSDAWYPGGAGGNFFVPLKQTEQKKRRPHALQRSPSFTGAVDVEQMTKQMDFKSDHKGDVASLSHDLSHLMWNAAQREKAWVDGHKEDTRARLQRSMSFESAVKIMEAQKEQEQRDEKEAEDLWRSQKGRLYRIPFNYNTDQGRRKGTVRVSVIQEKEVHIKVVPEKGDKGPGDLLLHWGAGVNDVHEWSSPDKSAFDSSETRFEGSSAQTKLQKRGSGEQEVNLKWTKAPQAITFVLKDGSNGCWYKPDANNFNIPITELGRAAAAAKGPADGGASRRFGIVRSMSGREIMAPDGAGIAREIIDSEGGSHMTLMHRYNHACGLIEKTPPGKPGRDAMMMIFCWLRFSQIRQLTWQRNYNTKPRELSAAAERLNKLITWRWKNAGPAEKEILLLMLGCVGRGGSGGDGQAIRDEILHIMHRHHLPEAKGTFVEEWHQKLHNNSTPDDIIICQAYLRFLETNGNMDEFWKVLHENGLDREKLAKYERAITTEPQFFGDKKHGLIHDFQNYLRILKNVHAGADLEKSVEVCKGFLDGHINVLLETVLRERGASEGRVLGVVDTITEVRQLISLRMTKEGDITKLRDMLYLDLGLEAQMRLMAERAMGLFNHMGIQDLTRSCSLWISLAAENLVYSSSPGMGKMAPEGDAAAESNEIKACLRDWAQLVEDAHKGVQDGWAKRAMSVVERLRRALGGVVDMISGKLQHKAEYLGYGLASVTPEKIPEKWSITLFSEELIRGGGCTFVLSSLLRKLDKALRAQGGGAMWQVISQGKPGAVGHVEQVPDLMSIQAVTYDRPTILLANTLSGEEEVPPGVVGVITPEAPDVLAHISVRARNLKVFFAGCFDQDEFESLAQYAGKRVSVAAAGDRVTFTESKATGTEEEKMEKMEEAMSTLKLELPPPVKFSKFALPEKEIYKEYKPKIFGAKSQNIVKLRNVLPDWIETPRSCTIPFGVYEKVMDHPQNKQIKQDINDLVKDELPTCTDAGYTLSKIKHLVMELKAPDDLVKVVRQALIESEIIKENELQGDQWEEAYKALKGVWASKWNDRAYYSCKKANIGVAHVQMAVLVQRLVEAEYAYVIHTQNPFRDAPHEMYAEVVVGLGETLVGNFPGRAFGFAMRKDGKGEPEVVSLPSKSVGLFGGGLIFRSDSNGEDLPGFAGAGLYDSIPMVRNKKKTLLYHKEPLTTDQGFMKKMVNGICKVAADVEKSMDGVPQDIEGCFKDGKFFVVQTRPQV